MKNPTNIDANPAKIETQKQSEWVIDVSDTSMILNHMPTGLAFWLKKNGNLEPSGDEDHPYFQDIFDEATQMAEELASEEWKS